jgi:hypothetical protein
MIWKIEVFFLWRMKKMIFIKVSAAISCIPNDLRNYHAHSTAVAWQPFAVRIFLENSATVRVLQFTLDLDWRYTIEDPNANLLVFQHWCQPE